VKLILTTILGYQFQIFFEDLIELFTTDSSNSSSSSSDADSSSSNYRFG